MSIIILTAVYILILISVSAILSQRNTIRMIKVMVDNEWIYIKI
jgi:hypothetical protein